MSDDKIEDIRKRHEDVSWRYHELPVIYDDRATLLAEVDRQREEIEQLRGALGLRDALRHAAGQEEIERLRSDLDTAIRERDEARAALKPFAALFLWPDDFGDESIRADEDWSDKQSDAQLDDTRVRRGDIRAARKALEAKP